MAKYVVFDEDWAVYGDDFETEEAAIKVANNVSSETTMDYFVAKIIGQSTTPKTKSTFKRYKD